MLTKKSMAALSGPAIPMFALMMPLVVFIPPYYAQHMGISLAMVGTIFMLGRMFDVITDPIAGVVMDRSRHRVPKSLWVVIGAVPLALGTWQVFFAEAPGNPATLMSWLLVLYAGWTLMSVGLYSWAGEVTSDYHERSRMMGAVQLANTTGTILVLLVPVFIEFLMPGEDIGRMRVQAMGGAILLMLPVTLLVAWIFGPRSQSSQTTNADFWPALKHAIGDVALRRLLVADFAVGLSIGSFTSVSVFFIEIVLQLEGRAGLLQLVLLIASLLGLPLFVNLAGRFQKHKTLVICTVVTALGSFVAAALPVGSLAAALVCYVILGVASGASQMLPRAMMSDVLDQTSLETDGEKTGLYFSFLTTTLKLGLGMGVGLTFGIAGMAGFDPLTAATDDAGHWIIRSVLAGLPVLLSGMIIWSMWNFPIDRARQREVAQKLAAE